MRLPRDTVAAVHPIPSPSRFGSPLALLPHRAPFLLVDRVLCVEGEQVTAEKRLTADDPLLVDGVLPGPLLIEALAQTSACLMGAGNAGREHLGYLVAAQGWKFPSRARAGDTLALTAVRTATLGALHRFDGVARVGEREVASGSMSFAVRFGAPLDDPAHGR